MQASGFCGLLRQPVGKHPYSCDCAISGALLTPQDAPLMTPPIPAPRPPEQERRATTPNLEAMDKVRVGLVGCGGFQRYRVSNLLKVPEAEVTALCDTDTAQISAMKKAYPALVNLPVFTDYHALAASREVDAIFIATPHTQHVDQILAGLEEGLHVLCEKPMVTSVADARRVIEARDRAGKQGMVSYQRHFQPE